VLHESVVVTWIYILSGGRTEKVGNKRAKMGGAREMMAKPCRRSVLGRETGCDPACIYRFVDWGAQRIID
jgi:hypothetical protein